ncbi:hypothetical protein DHEL01_v206387 [Diaporthe helianthi]|uniref:Uncharacterized protein n=1 Tax=Diaporthe helianthi TaxID=158607 RepID=A0A2P5HY88_DIAHE|nr:hypothetical protein DHEL01_v206387 [Diaporthe helianthi]
MTPPAKPWTLLGGLGQHDTRVQHFNHLSHRDALTYLGSLSRSCRCLPIVQGRGYVHSAVLDSVTTYQRACPESRPSGCPVSSTLIRDALSDS